MKSAFRLYARTSRGNDAYLHQELRALGLRPKHEDLLHAFYFEAGFQDLFRLSFQAYSVEHLYLQVGHKFPLYLPGQMEPGDSERLVADFLRGANLRNYLPMQRNLVENITLKLLVRESSHNLASERVILSLLQNHLRREVYLREYRRMSRGAQEPGRLDNYYEIKQIVDKKWEHEDYKRQEITALLQANNPSQQQLITDASV